MIYTCDKCGKTFEDDPGYLAYGIKKGSPFITKLCKECRESDTQSKVEPSGGLRISEELGILGQ